MSVMHKDGPYPVGPYGYESMSEAEHHDRDWIECGDWCIHNYMFDISAVVNHKRPVPINDNLDNMPWGWLFGFPSFNTLKTWFYGDLRSLHRFGFVVGVYDVENTEVRHGWHQSVFDWEFSVRVGEMSLLSRLDKPRSVV